MKVLTYMTFGVVLLLGACSSNSADPGSSRASTTASSHSPSSTTSTADSPTAAAAPTEVGPARCGDAVGVKPHPFTLAVAGAKLPAATLGTGADVAVLLHQTDGDGACGWFPVAGMIASQGVRVLAFDLCGYGATTCTSTTSPALQVRAAVRWARSHGARHVTVVGASMGGSVALGTAAKTAPDAVVDLSGPMTWEGVTGSTAAARALRVPLLGAVADGDPSTDSAALRRAVLSSPAKHRFVTAPDGHGIEMLASYKNGKDVPTPLLRTVVRWIKGDYS